MEEGPATMPLGLYNQRVGDGEADSLMNPGGSVPPVGSPWGGVHAGVLAGIGLALVFAIAAFASALALGLDNKNGIDDLKKQGKNQTGEILECLDEVKQNQQDILNAISDRNCEPQGVFDNASSCYYSNWTTLPRG